ncbi:MAG: leucyl aminopeptidase [Acidobacteria bacterium]|nr:leucyl aminopeptidase [Acidobacteriota bacterium]
MDITVISQPLAQVDAGALAVIVFENTSVTGDHAIAADQASGGWITELFTSGEFTGKALETAVLARPAGLAAKKLVAIGGGKLDTFSTVEMRRIAGALVRLLKPKKSGTLALAIDAAHATIEMASAATEGAILGDFETDQYKTDPKKNDAKVTAFSLVTAASDAITAGVARGRILAESQNFTRDLVNEPGNKLTPTVLAERAKLMAAEVGLECDVLGPDRMKQLGMGALLGVSIGSAEPPAMIVIQYKPEKPSDANVHLGLVGKGVTFDTGGISIKPSEGMEKMKYDMAGGASVLGAMRALALLKPPIPVTFVIPTVENMPGSKAQRPGDIVTTMNGKTVEVLNTDAEGRLILCDALEYAKRLGCTHLVDTATLTGAIVVALGYINVGVFANDEAFRGRLLESARAEGEKMWAMPIDEDYKELLKSPFADMANIGGRWGGAISAAMFLKEFADPVPWIHLDIAGTAWLEENKPFMAKGPSGVGVRTFVSLAMNWK